MRTFILLSLILSSATYADYTCSGKIKNINQGKTGTVSIISPEMYGNSDGRKICSVSETWKDVNPEACKAWLSKLFMAKASEKSLIVQYVDSASCTTHPTWSNAHAPWGIWEAE